MAGQGRAGRALTKTECMCAEACWAAKASSSSAIGSPKRRSAANVSRIFWVRSRLTASSRPESATSRCHAARTPPSAHKSRGGASIAVGSDATGERGSEGMEEREPARDTRPEAI